MTYLWEQRCLSFEKDFLERHGFLGFIGFNWERNNLFMFCTLNKLLDQSSTKITCGLNYFLRITKVIYLSYLTFLIKRDSFIHVAPFQSETKLFYDSWILLMRLKAVLRDPSYFNSIPHCFIILLRLNASLYYFWWLRIFRQKCEFVKLIF